MDPPLTLSHIQKLTQLTVSTYLSHHSRHSFISAIIIRLVATSPSLKRLILCASIGQGFDVGDMPEFCRPLALLVSSSLEHIELGIVTVLRFDEQDKIEFDRDIITSLMGVPELKKLCDTGFLSVRGLEKESFF